MTVSYNLEMANNRPAALFRILFRWRGSVWKAVYLELLVWLFLYACVTLIYRTGMSTTQMHRFENLTVYLDKKVSLVPLNMMLAFFVNAVIARWTTLFANIGLIDSLALSIAAFVVSNNVNARMVRRSLVRHCVLAQVLLLRDISLQVRNRFPTLDTVVAAGFMTEFEKEKYVSVQNGFANYWIPLHWALSTLKEARPNNIIPTDTVHHRIAEEIKSFRASLQTVCNYDWVPLPVLYPQVVFLVVYIYFALCLISRQYLISHDKTQTEVDMVFPVMTMLEFIFYMGWMKVAQGLLNPLGEDDDDLECNFLVDRNLTIGLSIVDDPTINSVPLVKDQFWNHKVEQFYSEDTTDSAKRQLVGSTANIKLPADVTEVTMVQMPVDNVNDEQKVHPSVDERRKSIVPVQPNERQLKKKLSVMGGHKKSSTASPGSDHPTTQQPGSRNNEEVSPIVLENGLNHDRMKRQGNTELSPSQSAAQNNSNSPASLANLLQPHQLDMVIEEDSVTSLPSPVQATATASEGDTTNRPSNLQLNAEFYQDAPQPLLEDSDNKKPPPTTTTLLI